MVATNNIETMPSNKTHYLEKLNNAQKSKLF